MTDKQQKQLGRLMLRKEGEFWNAYYGLPPDTPKDEDWMEPELLGSIRMTIVERDPTTKDLFVKTMREVVSFIIEEAIGTRPSWTGFEKAPESERAGHD